MCNTNSKREVRKQIEVICKHFNAFTTTLKLPVHRTLEAGKEQKAERPEVNQDTNYVRHDYKYRHLLVNLAVEQAKSSALLIQRSKSQWNLLL